MQVLDEPLLVFKNPFHRIRHIPGQPVTYLQNPKVACTSIELTLWKARDSQGAPVNPHTKVNRPFVRRKDADTALESLPASHFFSVVRNPYSRVLSAYLNKVGKDRGPWARICASFGMTPESSPSLEELLSALAYSDPYEADHHFRPQYINTMYGFAPLDYLGHFERMEDVFAFLRKHGFELHTSNKHATRASTRISDYIGPREARLIQSYYERDFTIYGYSDNPEQIAPVRNTLPLSTDREPLRRFVEGKLWKRSRAAAGNRQTVAART